MGLGAEEERQRLLLLTQPQQAHVGQPEQLFIRIQNTTIPAAETSVPSWGEILSEINRTGSAHYVVK